MKKDIRAIKVKIEYFRLSRSISKKMGCSIVIVFVYTFPFPIFVMLSGGFDKMRLSNKFKS